jgi:membrane-bound lytic murein transglycosylase D
MAPPKLARLLTLLAALLTALTSPGVEAQESNLWDKLFGRVSAAPANAPSAAPENASSAAPENASSAAPENASSADSAKVSPADTPSPPTAPPAERAPAASASSDAPLAASTPSEPETTAPPLARLEFQDTLGSIRTVDLTTEPDDLWQRMRNGFGMPDLVNDLVTSHQVWFLNRPDYLRRTFERSRRYIHFIVAELEKRGMPTELALLPMVESAYNPLAISPAKASGMWQFIPSTGRNFGLKQDWWADERRDIVASTNAALDYLQLLYEMQGDWHLALASYNWGEGAVARAMARNKAAGKPVDYMSLTMPAETRNYVPKLQALKNIIANPRLFGFNLPDIPNRPYFTAIQRPADMDVATAARLAETPMEEFRALNPGHNRPVLRARSGTSLVLPADKVDTFRVNLENSDKPLVSWKNYQLGHKESLAKVAAKFGISLAQLRQINGLTARSKFKSGQVLLVPAKNGDGKIDDAGIGLTPPPEALAPAKSTKHGKAHHASHGKRAKSGKSAKAAKPAKAAKATKATKAKPGKPGKSEKSGAKDTGKKMAKK